MCSSDLKPLSEKQLGKQPLVQSHAQPRVEQRPPPKKTHAIAPQVEEPTMKKGKSRCCYLCREKGHLASSCTNGTLSNPIIIDDIYSLRKDWQCVSQICGDSKWCQEKNHLGSKPIVTNLLGPNLVEDQQAKT